jgi:hypothetical protein
MALKTYVNNVGQDIGTFHVDTILRYVRGEPVYGCSCECGAKNVAVAHDDFRLGTARCSATGHFAAMSAREHREQAAATAAREQARQHRTEVEREQAERAGRKAAREKAERERVERVEAEFRRYGKHVLFVWDRRDWLLPLQHWMRMSDEARQLVFRRIADDPNTPFKITVSGGE